MSGKKVTRDEVARLAGVSAATVSYVINDGPRPVSSATRRQVLQAVQELGYRPNAVARNLRRQRTTTLGLIIPDTSNPYFAKVARGVEQMASGRQYSVVLCHSNYEVERELHYVEVLAAEQAAGVLWIPASGDDRPAQRLAKYGVPLVVLDRRMRSIDAPSVIADNFGGANMAIRHLIDLGHSRIAFITRPSELSHSRDRERGYRSALIEHGMEVDEELIVRGGFRHEDGRGAATRLLKMMRAPTAIFAYNDIMAIGALRAAYDLGLQVPGDVSIVGFDDIPGAACTCPALTTVSQPKEEMGWRSAELLIGLLADDPPHQWDEAPFQVDLIVRDSTGPA